MAGKAELEPESLVDEIFGPQEELHPDLQPYLRESETGFWCIQHPLTYSVLHHERLNHLVNQQYTAKLDAVAEAFKDGDYRRYVWLHERPYRTDALEVCADLMTDQDYWTLLGHLWTDTENAWQASDLWRLFFESDRPGRDALMTQEERDILDEYSKCEHLTIYRGFNGDGDVQGLSWTLNSVVAKFFARRFARSGEPMYIAKGTIEASKIVAHFCGRSEEEVICLPEDVDDITVEQIYLKGNT